MPTKISIQHVGKLFGEGSHQVEALKDVSLDIADNEFVTFVGASGCGKSTLLRIVGGLEYHTAGEVLVDGRPILGPGADRAMVFQHYSLYPWLRVMENIKFSRRLKHGRESITEADVEAASGRADALLALMGLTAAANAWPNQLSGGMQQRVGLARALTNDAPILLMDEAFSALDPLIRADMQGVLLDLQQEIGKTIVFITHDLDEALRLGDRIAILRDGEVVQQGTGQQIVLQPADDYISNFVKDVNRGRVIRCRTLAQKLDPVDGPSVDASLIIEEAARLLSAEGREAANVVNAKGRHLGVVSMTDIIAAMVPPASS